MKITPCFNNGKARWRVNIQHRGYRRRMFFERRSEAVAFCVAAQAHAAKFSSKEPSRYHAA